MPCDTAFQEQDPTENAVPRPDPGHRFEGTETLGVEVRGSLPRSRAVELGGDELPYVPEPGGGRVRASILTVMIRELAVRGLPRLRFDYPETLWLLHLAPAGRQVRLAVRAQTRLAMFPGLEWVDNYHTEIGRHQFSAESLDTSLELTLDARAGGRYAIRLAGPSPAPSPFRIGRLFTRTRWGRLYEIPWGGGVPRQTGLARVELLERDLVDRIFGPAFRCAEQALWFQDRAHACSPAYGLDAGALAPGQASQVGGAT